MAFTPGMSRSVEVQVQSSGVDAFNSAMGGVTDSLIGIKPAVGIASGALAALAGGALVAAIDKAREFEDAMVEVRKVTAEGVGKQLRDDVMDMAESIPLARDELAAITADAARFGVQGEENIRKFAETAAQMATATNLSAEEAGESLAKLATITDTPVSKMENLGSSINALSNNAATSTDEIVQASLKASGSLSQLGVRQTDIFALTTALNAVSPSARRAGTRLRRVGQELLNPKKAQDVAAALGMTTEEFRNQLKQDPTAMFVRLAETMNEGGEGADKLRTSLSSASRTAISGLSGNLPGLNDALNRSRDEFDKNTSIAEEFELKVNTLTSQLQLLKNRITNAAVEIGSVFLPPITDAVKSVNQFLDDMGGLTGMIDEQEAAWGLLGTTVAGTIGAIVGLLGLPLAPVAALVGGVAALAAAWKTNFGGIRDQIKSFLGVVQDTLGEAREFIMAVLSDVLEVWDRHGAAIMSKVERIFGFVVDFIVGTLNFLHKNVFQPALNAITQLWNTHGGEMLDNVARFIGGVLDFIIVGLRTLELAWEKWGDEILAYTKFIFDGIGGIIKFALDAIMTVVGVITDIIAGDFGEALDKIKGFWDRTLSGLFGFIKNWGSALLNYLAGLLGSLVGWATDVGAGIGKWIMNGINGLVEDAKSAFDDLVSWVKNLPGRIRQAIGNFAKGVGAQIKQAINDALGLPRDIEIGSVSVQGNEVFAGKTFTIPALAEGGIVDGATMAMVGEAGPEAIIPLDRLEGVMGAGGLTAAQIQTAIQAGMSGMTLEVVGGEFVLDGEVVTVEDMEARIAQKEAEDEQRQRRQNTRRR
jgi:TP901 family phage tail tape measure protein